MNTQNNAAVPDSATLYRDCQSADRNAQREAYTFLWQYLFRIVYRLVYDQFDARELAADCTQDALVRIHTRIQECKEPNAFLGWSKRIVNNLAIDELRRRKRRKGLQQEASDEAAERRGVAETSAPDAIALSVESLDEIRTLLNQAPISERSRRLVSGRYLDDVADEALAKVESEIAGDSLRPSHLQVTRSKNMSKLRDWERLQDFLK